MATEQTQRDERFRRDGDEPDSPTKLKGRSWFGVLKRTVTEFKEDNLTDWAASLTYYGILALFPGLLVLISLIGLAGANTAQSLIDNIASSAPGSAKTVITNALREIQNSGKGSAGLLFIIGLAGALWSASAYVGAFSRASNAIYEVGEGRPFWKLRPQQLAVTALLLLLLVASSLAVVITGPVAEQLGNLVGAGSTAVTIWEIAKWPVI